MRRKFMWALPGAAALVASAHAPLRAGEHAGSACASAALTQTTLRDFLPGLVFERDSSSLDFVTDSLKTSDLDRYARRVSSPRSCLVAHRVYLQAIGGVINASAPPAGTVAVVRIGSYYLIAEPDVYELVLTTRTWRVLAVIGLDND